MEEYTNIRKMFVLDVIRNTGNCIPITEEANDLTELVEEMVADDLLEVKDDCYKVSSEGKKALLYFDNQRETMNEPLEPFKEIMIGGKVVDGRVPMMSYLLVKSGSQEVETAMKSAIFSIKWEDMINSVKEMSTIENADWKELIAQDKFYTEVYGLAKPDAWLELGKTEEEADSVGQWILNPGFVQITV